MRFCFLAIAGLGLFACKTTTTMKARTIDSTETEPVSTFDGATDSIDSLPDCTPELAGSLFWVRADKSAYDCTTAGEWVARPNLDAPTTEN